jgi:hypothetical protein
MVNHTNRGNIQSARPDILWRLLLTVLLLLALAGFGLTIFDTVTTRSDAQVLPPLSQEVEGAGPR